GTVWPHGGERRRPAGPRPRAVWHPEPRKSAPPVGGGGGVPGGTATPAGVAPPPMIARPQPASTNVGPVHHVWADAGIAALATATVSIVATAARLSNIFFTMALRGLGLCQPSFTGSRLQASELQVQASAIAAPSVVMLVLQGGGLTLRVSLCATQPIHEQLHIG